MLSPGDRLGRYELLTPVAKGGMAQVWAARLVGSHGFQKVVAIKTILEVDSDRQRLEQMFLEEARLASYIQHPNVTQALELGEREGVLYLALEWVAGEPLSVMLEVARGGTLPVAVAVNLLGQACRGLHAAHEARDGNGTVVGIVHRDISPANILVTYTGTVKLVDFGVAKAEIRNAGLTERGELKGKVAFMAPEQLLSEGVDRRADLFSLGVILFRMLTGQEPFPTHSPEAICDGLLAGKPPLPPSAFNRACSPALDKVVLRSLCVNRNERWPTALEMLEGLIQAEPGAFVPDAESVVAEFMMRNFGTRAEAREAQLQRAQRLLDRQRSQPTERLGSEMPPSSLGGTAHSTSLVETGALLVVPASQPLPQPPRRHLGVWPLLLGTAAAVGGYWFMPSGLIEQGLLRARSALNGPGAPTSVGASQPLPPGPPAAPRPAPAPAQPAREVEAVHESPETTLDGPEAAEPAARAAKTKKRKQDSPRARVRAERSRQRKQASRHERTSPEPEAAPLPSTAEAPATSELVPGAAPNAPPANEEHPTENAPDSEAKPAEDSPPKAPAPPKEQDAPADWVPPKSDLSEWERETLEGGRE